MTSISEIPHKTVLKTVTIQQYPMSLAPEVYVGVTNYEYTCMAEYSYFVVRGVLTEDNIPYEVYIPLSNIVHIKVEG